MLVRGIVNGALRMIGALGSGREPQPADAFDTLEALQSLYRGWILGGAFGRLCDVVPTIGDYVAQPNERVYRQSEAVETVSLPALVAGWQTWDCRTCDLRWNDYCDPILGLTYQPNYSAATTPRDGSVVVIADECRSKTFEFLYDGHVKKWMTVHDLTLDSEAPRSVDATGLMACLAIEIAPQFASDIQQAAMMQSVRYKNAMAGRYSMPRQSVEGVYY